MIGLIREWNGGKDIKFEGNYKELMPVTIRHDTEEYEIDGIKLTAAQVEQIVVAYDQYQEVKADQAKYRHAMELTKAMHGTELLNRV